MHKELKPVAAGLRARAKYQDVWLFFAGVSACSVVWSGALMLAGHGNAATFAVYAVGAAFINVVAWYGR